MCRQVPRLSRFPIFPKTTLKSLAVLTENSAGKWGREQVRVSRYQIFHWSLQTQNNRKHISRTNSFTAFQLYRMNRFQTMTLIRVQVVRYLLKSKDIIIVFHPEIKTAYLESIEYHIKYKDPSAHNQSY